MRNSTAAKASSPITMTTIVTCRAQILNSPIDTSTGIMIAHPSAACTLQQLREAVGFERRYQYPLHDRDSIFTEYFDESVKGLGI
jgi:hypothetical protein